MFSNFFQIKVLNFHDLDNPENSVYSLYFSFDFDKLVHDLGKIVYKFIKFVF